MTKPAFAALGVSAFVLLAAGCASKKVEQLPTPATLPSTATTQPDSAAIEYTESQLKKVLPDVRFDNVRLADALSFVSDQSGATIDVDWAEVERIGIQPDTQVTTRLRNVRLAKVLKTVLESASGGGRGRSDELVAPVADNGVIRVTTLRRLFALTASTKRYPVDDLLVSQPSPATSPSASTTQAEMASVLKNQIRSLILDVIAQGTWVDDAPPEDALGKITFDGNTIVVTHTPDVHRQIAGLLVKLRERRDPPPQQRTSSTTQP